MHAHFSLFLVFYYLTLCNLGFSQVAYEKIELIQVPIGNQIIWSTIEEENNRYFVVEKSINRTDFKELIQIPKQEEINNIREYNFLDVNNNNSMSYYRIKQVNKSGNFSYSQVIQATNKFENNIDILNIFYPSNKNSATLSIHFYSLKQGVLNYTLKDENEIFHLNETSTIDIGENYLEIPFSNLEKGIYLVCLKIGTETESMLIEYNATNSILVSREKRH